MSIEKTQSTDLPRKTNFELREQMVHRKAIASLMLEMLTEVLCESILIDPVILPENRHNRKRHLGIVSEVPLTSRHSTIFNWCE